ncbi:(2Fe-2S)-binding protein [Longibaculum muris]|uniref:(2Fe-2S)-binding protein n=1 Tax=Longibaculum muris TaxID=1796628 RepID=UPI0022E2D1DB|nr:2Fe-2S iron-sulfur cluster-binding protein [Longibaculum muris]
MEIKMNLNGKDIVSTIEPDTLLIDFLRQQGCLSVKRGCDTSNCGLCTVFQDDQPILSCSVLAARAAGHKIVTLEGMQKEAQGFAEFIADQGAEQCGFCNPGMMMNTMALLRENDDPSDEDILNYLAGNLCRCSGYEGQLRGIKNYIAYLKRSGKEDLS